MKKIIRICGLLTLIFIGLIQQLDAQSVAINADSSKADASAILDLKSTKKGMLLPRMTMVQRNGITAAATGLLIYQTDNTAGYYYYDGSGWTALKSTSGGGGGGGGTDSNWSASGADIHNVNTGNVVIGTGTAISKLTVQSNGLGLAQTNGVVSMATYVNGSGAWFGTITNHPLFFYTNNGVSRMAISANGNIGVGANTPANKFQIGDFSGTGPSANDFAIGNNGSWLAMNEFDGYSQVGTNGNLAIIPGGNVGILTRTPNNKLQIGSTGSTGFTGNDFAIGNGNAATAFNQYANIFQVASNKDFVFLPRANSTGGSVGINSSAPANTLQVGDVGTTGFIGNHFAIGNGNAATAFNQYDNYFQVASNKDFVFLPRAGTGGRVGINTSIPKAALDVEGFVASDPLTRFAYLGLDHGFSGYSAQTDVALAAANISIYASNNVMALQMDVFSDARIKDIKGVSDSKKDLAILKAIKVTDYTFKDKIRNGTHPSKKVIAQEVEKIYPQIVSRHTDFIPNVYQRTDTVTKVGDNYLLSFTSNHHLGDAAKKIQVLLNEENHLESFDIVSIPSSKEVIINGKEIKTAHVFVYGEEVNDFRTVDYEGLTTLNISATQEISRLVGKLQKMVAMQTKKITALEQTVAGLRQKPINRLSRATLPSRRQRANSSATRSL